MTKNELRNGMVAKCNDGSWGIIMKDTKINDEYVDAWIDLRTGQWMNLNRYNDFLECINCLQNSPEYTFDIVAEYRSTNLAIKRIINGNEISLNNKDIKVLWERCNPQITEVQSLITELQGQLKAAQNKLEAIQCMA